jgi:hypothetical protein
MSHVLEVIGVLFKHSSKKALVLMLETMTATHHCISHVGLVMRILFNNYSSQAVRQTLARETMMATHHCMSHVGGVMQILFEHSSQVARQALARETMMATPISA